MLNDVVIMKQILRVVTVAVLVALLSWGSVASGFAQEATGRPFITKWQGTKGEELRIPIVGTDYKLVIKNEKGEVVKSKEKVTVTDYYAFTPKADGVYTVEAGPEGVKSMQMRAEMEDMWNSIPMTSNARLLEVVQFGTVAWASMERMFWLCRNMTFAAGIDTPDLTKVTAMSGMFWGCDAFNQPLEKWDVSKVTNMFAMFNDCIAFNQPLEKWDVSQVTDMSVMFRGCSAFNQPLEKWTVRQVTNMSEMFSGCRAFNQPLEKWNVSQVTNMSNMFDGCIAFNQPLEKWNVSQVTNMGVMFTFCTAFNQPLEKWDVSQVTNMSVMFEGCRAFNQPLEKWNVSQVTNMSEMFRNCSAFNQPLEKWTVSQVTDMSEMFVGCSAFNQPLEKWDVSQVTNMRWMFYGCSAFNQPLGKWDVSQVTNMSLMFYGCSAFNQPLEKWDVSKVTNMSGMFSGCSAFNQPLGEWNVSQVTEMHEMFSGCSAFNQPLEKWKIKTAVGGLGSTAMSPSNYSATLAGWAAQSEIAENVDFIKYNNVSGLIYNNEGKAAREKLIGKGWRFEGDEYQGSGVTITPRELRLRLNEEFTLPLEKWGVEEGEKVTLSSREEGILSYTLTEDGKGVRIQGLKVGECELTATIAAKEGGHEAYTSTCRVEVVPIFVKYITITPASQTLSVNQEITLEANVFPTNAAEKGVTWSSSNPEIATVDETGKVTAKKKGTCTITAKAKGEESSVVGTCTITVELVSVTGISVTPPSTPLKVGESVTLTATIAPENASEKRVTWSSSNPEIATVDPETGKVTAKKKGTCTITAKTKEEGSSVEGTCTIVVVENNNGGGNGGGSWQPQTPKAVEDAVLASLAVAPNLFTSQLRIENPEGVAVRYELVNAAGLVMRAGAFSATEVIVDTEALSAGVYFVRIETQNGAKRVVKVFKY